MEKSACAVRCGRTIGIKGKTSVRCWPATSSITTNCGSFIPEKSAARDAHQTPIAASTTSSPTAQISGKATTESWMSLPGTRKCLSEKTASESGSAEKMPRKEVGCRKKIAERNAVATPTNEP